MNQRRKLQVFVSSTYTDLLEERQAAVEAILTAGHIPAGMELFAAGDQSQMDAIRRWIDESDVFLLILGARYGSIDPATGKSYIQLEYEYALERQKPLFAVVVADQHIDERVKKHGRAAIETERTSELKAFRAIVTSRLVRFWSNPLEIKLSILETLAEYSRLESLTGWIRGGGEVDIAPLASEVARLSAENAALRERLAQHDRVSFGVSFDELRALLSAEVLPPFHDNHRVALEQIARAFGEEVPTLLHGFWYVSGEAATNSHLPDDLHFIPFSLEEFGLIEANWDSGLQTFTHRLTATGQQFYLRLRLTLASNYHGLSSLRL